VLDESTQDALRGPRAYADANETIAQLHDAGIPFDVNVTAVRDALKGIRFLVEEMERRGARRVNIHWPSRMGLGSSLAEREIPSPKEWRKVRSWIENFQPTNPGFFVEIERGYLEDDEAFGGCAIEEMTNLQIFPDLRVYRCGLLVDDPDMSSLRVVQGEVRLEKPLGGEQALLSIVSSCDSCPLRDAERRHACIYDKVSSLR
jgi:MoaA/NifB/PqqE/SkfB family radical SAM enzyme